MSKPLFVCESPLFLRSGYTGLSEAIARSLIRSNLYDLFFVPTRWGSCSRRNLDLELPNDSELQMIVSKVLQQPLNRQPEIFCKISIPTEFNSIGKFNLGITAGLECSLCPPQWIEGINKVHHTIVTSEHSKKVFESTSYTKNYNDGRKEILKLEKPIDVLFWGIDTNVFKKTDETNDHLEKFMADIKEDFAFLFVGQWTGSTLAGDRKNIGMLVKLFIETFRGLPLNKRPCLILKTSGATLSKIDKYECVNKLKSIIDMVGNSPENPNVYILHGDLSNKEMNCLYNHKKVKVHISLMHGEGFGMPLLEATMSGKPLLCSNWSGPLDFLDSRYCKLIPGELKQIPGEAVNEYFPKEALWFEPNYFAASGIMKGVFNHYEFYLPNAEKLAVINSQKFSIQEMDKKFWGILDRIVPKFSLPQSIVLPKLKKITLPIRKPEIANLPKQEETNKTLVVSESKSIQ